MKRPWWRALCAPVICAGFLAPAQAALVSFIGGSITIPGSETVGPGNPYPSTVNVSGLTGTVSSLDVLLLGLSHEIPDDLDILLVAPGGQTLLLMSDVGGSPTINAIDLTFRDGSPSLTDNGPLVSGTYAPTNFDVGVFDDSFPAPARSGPYGTTIANLLTSDANGSWQLFTTDDAAGDVGALGSWRLDFTTSESVSEPSALALVGIVFAAMGFARRRAK